MKAARSLQTVSVVEAATNRLRESLFTGDYSSGQEVKDTHIAQEFGIARPTARIAVQNLVNEGMLDRKPGASARVRVFGPDQVTDIYRVRRLIELDAIREIRQQGLSLHRVTQALTEFDGLEDDENWATVAEADVEFHRAVVNSASSPRLQTFFAGITSELRLLFSIMHAQYTGARALYCEHHDLLGHLRNSSEEDLEAAWVHHLETAQSFIEQDTARIGARSAF